MNVFEGIYRNKSVEALGARWPVSGARATEGQRVKYGIRPEHIDLGTSAIPAEVVVVEPMGAETELLVKVQDQTLTLLTHGRSGAGPGERVLIAPQPQHAHLFDATSGRRL
jgi:multiple sugar transport system ATP-binding protein